MSREEYYEARQHLNLSRHAFDVIESDKLDFMERPSFSGMLNRIFASYREEAAAAIDLRTEEYRQTLSEALGELPDSAEKNTFLRILTAAYRQKCVKTVNSYDRDCQFKVQLSRENYAFIQNWRDERGDYQGSAGRFIKAVLEEYASLSYYEREEIILRERLEQIKGYIADERLLHLTLRVGTGCFRFEVKPFSICTDGNRSFHYLAALSRPAGSAEREQPASFRLSRIESIRSVRTRTGHITAAQRDMLTGRIREVGVQFLLQEPETVRVRFTPEGKQLYRNHTHLRPACAAMFPQDDGSWVGDFFCSPIQASYYFFKFGQEAQILFPPSLRRDFRERYLVAAQCYEKEEIEK